MSDRPSTEADRLVELGKSLGLDVDLAVHASEHLLYAAAALHLRNAEERLAEVLMGVRFQTGDGVVMCEHCEKCVEEDEAVQDHVAQCWWCIPCSEAAIERSKR